MPAGYSFARSLRHCFFLLGVVASGIALTQGSRPASSGTQAANPSVPTTEWVTVRGQASDLAISPEGDVFALDADERMWKLPASEVRTGGSGWLTQPGRYKHVRATHDRTMWAIDRNDVLYRLRGSVWYRILDTVHDVAASPDGQTLILTTEGKVFDLATQQPFLPLPPESSSRTTSIVMDAHGLPWLQREDSSAVRFNGTAWQVVAGPREQLVMIGTGYEGSVLGVAADGQILSYAPMRNAWQPYVTDGRAIPPMRQISLSPIGLPWGISRSGELLAERSLSKTPPAPPASPALFTKLLTWRTTGGASTRVSVGQDGTVYSTSPEGALYQRKRGNEWTSIPFNEGQIRLIASGTEGRGWVLTDKAAVFQFERGGFRSTLQTPGQVRLIAAGPKGLLWAALIDNQVSRYNATRQWEAVVKLPDTPVAFAIGMRDEPWYIDSKGVVKTRRVTGEWTSIEGIKATSLSVGPEGTVYATSDAEGVYWLDAREMRWKPASGKAVQISVGPGGAPWAITAKNEMLASGRFLDEQQARDAATTPTKTASTTQTTTTETKTTATSTITTTTTPTSTVIVSAPKPATTKPLVYDTILGDARFSDIGIGKAGNVFAVSVDGGLMCFSNAANRFVLASSGIASRVAVAADGMPWILDNNGRVARFDKTRSAWQTIPGFVGADISFGPDGVLWGANSDGRVYKYNQGTSSFDLEPVETSDVAFRARRVAGANTGVYWVVSEQNQLLRCEKKACRVELVGAKDATVAPDNTLFVLNLTGNVQRYDVAKKTFEQQNGLGTAISAGPGGLPWLVTTAGKIDASGIFAASSKTINAPDCGAVFAAAPTPLPAPASVVLVANADTATLAPGASLDLLTNDTFSGRTASVSDVTVTLDTSTNLLALNGGSVVVSTSATAGAVLKGNYKICPRNVFGNCVSSTVSITVSGTTVAPTAVSAVPGNNSASITFTVPAGFAGVTITNYSVVSSPGSISVTGTGSPITVSGLTNGVPYTFTVTARYSNGITRTSDPSTPVIPTAAITEPSAPLSPTAVAASAQATVSFTTPASNGGTAILDYKVTSNPGAITATGTASPITVTGLTNGTTYTFTVQARNAIGLGAPSAATNSVAPPGAVVATVPVAPTGVSAAVAGPGALQVSFTPGADGGSPITNYTATSAPGGLVGGGAASPVVVGGLTGGTLYTFTVTATNAIGTSVASAPSVGVTAQDFPGAPTGLIDCGSGAGTICLSWGAPASTGGSAITQYTVSCFDTFLVAPIPPFFTAATSANLNAGNGVVGGNPYQCSVAAENAAFPGLPGPPAGPVLSNP